MEKQNIEEEPEIYEGEISSLHIESNECECPDCRCGKRYYIQIIDIDRYINALSDKD